MTETHRTKKNMHPLVAGGAGMVIGIAGVAVARAFMNKASRQKISKQYEEAKQKISTKMKSLQDSLENTTDKMKDITDPQKVADIENVVPQTEVATPEKKSAKPQVFSTDLM